MYDALEKIIESHNTMKTVMEQAIIKSMKEVFQAYFEEHSEIEALVWTQYTPYFNDGEPCEFRTSGDVFIIRKDKNEDEDNDDQDLYDRESLDWQSDFAKLLRKIPDEVYLVAFGDHAQVTATREGFQVDEYDHE